MKYAILGRFVLRERFTARLINAGRITSKRIASHGVRSTSTAAAVMIEVAASAFAAERVRLA